MLVGVQVRNVLQLSRKGIQCKSVCLAVKEEITLFTNIEGDKTERKSYA
jgi:hypothetical protein